MIITYATVTSISPLRIKFNHELEASNANYYKLSTYIPKVGDKVAVIKDDKNKYLILGGVN